MTKPAPAAESHLELALEPAGQALDAETRAAIWAEGRAMSADQAIGLALSR